MEGSVWRTQYGGLKNIKKGLATGSHSCNDGSKSEKEGMKLKESVYLKNFQSPKKERKKIYSGSWIVTKYYELDIHRRV